LALSLAALSLTTSFAASTALLFPVSLAWSADESFGGTVSEELQPTRKLAANKAAAHEGRVECGKKPPA
jgi:hypothetical protein